MCILIVFKLDEYEKVECQSPWRSLFIILNCFFLLYIAYCNGVKISFLFSFIIVLFTENEDFCEEREMTYELQMFQSSKKEMIRLWTWQ